MKPEEFRALVLQAAIRGKLVPQDPNDEPASVLLEKIRAEKQRLISEGKIKKSKNDSFIFKRDNHYYENTNGKEICIDDEIPFEIPDSWCWCRLGSIVEINPRNKLDDETIVSFIPMANITEGYHNIIKPETIKWEKGKKGYTHFKNDDIVFAKIIPCFQNLKSTVLHNLKNGYGCGTTEFFVIRCNMQHVVPEYVLWFVKNPLFIKGGLSTLKGTVGQQRIGSEYVEESLFPLPPILEQKAINIKINQLLGISNQHEQIIDIANLMKNELRASILNSAIQGKLVPQDPNDEPVKIDCKNPIIRRDNSYYEVVDGKEQCIDDEIPFDIPISWNWARLNDICKLTMGQSPEGNSISTRTNGMEFHQGKIFFGDQYLQESDVVTTLPTKIVEPYTILLCVRAPVGVINITPREICIGRGLAGIQPVYCDLMFTYYGLQTFKESLISKATGSTFIAITSKVVKNMPFPVPPLSEQKRIVSKIEKLFRLLSTLQ